MEKIEIVKGSIEHIQVNVRDRLSSLTDLAGANAVYDVRKETDEAPVVVGQPCVVTGMTAFCLIDTTLNVFTKDRYELLVRFTLLPEIPYLGPFDFEVV